MHTKHINVTHITHRKAVLQSTEVKHILLVVTCVNGARRLAQPQLRKRKKSRQSLPLPG